MKLFKLLYVTIAIVAIGCGSTPKGKTYQTIGALQAAVEVGLTEYNKWAVAQLHEHPENKANVEELDVKVTTALEAYKTSAGFALQHLKTGDVPTADLLDLANTFFNLIHQAN